MTKRPMPAPRTSVQKVITRAAQLGLEPCIGADSYRGAYRVILNGRGGTWTGFGAIFIGASSGRILRASLTFGNDGQTVRYTGHRGAQAMLRAYAAYMGDLSPRPTDLGLPYGVWLACQ
jgi:hypothetical protein